MPATVRPYFTFMQHGPEGYVVAKGAHAAAGGSFADDLAAAVENRCCGHLRRIVQVFLPRREVQAKGSRGGQHIQAR